MFFSLNKKLIYTISLFFIIASIIFTYAFYLINGNKIREEQTSSIRRNQQYLEILYEHNTLRNTLSQLKQEHPEIEIPESLLLSLKTPTLTITQEQISQERRKVNTSLKNYNERYQSLTQSVRIIIISSFSLLLALITLWILIHLWVLKPISKISDICQQVLSGNYKCRLQIPPTLYFRDEFYNLAITYNQMLDNIESGIKEIQSAESFLQSLIDSIPDGIRVFDTSGTIILANKEYKRQINNSKNCVSQKCYQSSQERKTICPQSLFTCPLQKIKSLQSPTLKFVQQFSAFPNRHLAINAAPVPTRDGDKQKFFIVESIRDLSEDIQFSHQQKLSSLGFLSTSVAHEMKNHLGSIKMIIEGLLNKYFTEDNDSSEIKKYLTLIQNQLMECIKVPERLLQMAQFSPLEHKYFSLSQSINDVIALLDYEASHSGSILKFSAPSQDTVILGNEIDFKMLIINLLQNALKAMPQGGEINISLQVSKEAVIKIQDTGIGIPEENLKRIFEPFYTKGHTSNDHGTGLGLAIAKSLTETLNGKIQVQSKINVGTCFTIKLPICKRNNLPK